MNRLLLKNFSTIKNTWCYRQGFYQIPKINNKELRKVLYYNDNIFSYGQWFEKSEKPLNRIERQNKIKKYLDQF